MNQEINDFLTAEKKSLTIISLFPETIILGGHEKGLKPFTMKNVRKLPIVGDVHQIREQRPYT